jgi:hypothetical protein
MQVTINDQEFDVPFHLAYITMKQYLDYYKKFGCDLIKRSNEIASIDYKLLLAQQGQTAITDDDIELAKLADMEIHKQNEALAWYSYWTGHDLFEVRNEPYIHAVINTFHIMRPGLFDERELKMDFGSEIEFAGEKWAIQDIKSKPGLDTPMSMTEFSITREVFKSMLLFKHGVFTVLPFLCAVYFRKMDEPIIDVINYFYNTGKLKMNEDRTTLLEDLPMNIAFSVIVLLQSAIEVSEINPIEENQ